MKKENIIIGVSIVAFGIVGYYLFDYGKKIKSIIDGNKKSDDTVDNLTAMAVKAGLDTVGQNFKY
jgi:hypothetical protein